MTQKHGREPTVDELLEMADEVDRELIKDEPARQRDELKLMRRRGVLERREATRPEREWPPTMGVDELVDAGMAPLWAEARPPANDINSLIQDFMG